MNTHSPAEDADAITAALADIPTVADVVALLDATTAQLDEALAQLDVPTDAEVTALLDEAWRGLD
jgi:hypothetical protein